MTDQLHQAISKYFAKDTPEEHATRMDRLVEERDKAPELFNSLPEARQAEINRWAARAGRRTGE